MQPEQQGLILLNRLEEFKHIVKIPCTSARHIIQQNELSLIAFWLSLKSMYASGAILHYPKRYKELAEYTGMCSKSVRNYIKKIQEARLAWAEGDMLMLSGKNVLVSRYGIISQTPYMRYHSFLKTTVKDIKLFIRAQAIKDNQYRQKAYHQSRLKKSLSKATKSEWVRSKRIQRVLNQTSFNKVHSKVKQSQQTIANVFGCKSKSSGNYWSKKLQRAKLIIVQKQEPTLLHKNVSQEFFKNFKNNVLKFQGYYSKGTIYRCNPSNIYVNL
ncbi:MAG TPA: hypothetical protein VJY62_17375 [Bacteroidia bacterium]|nr:hypothetical protein [Bacteroidia bacterium]